MPSKRSRNSDEVFCRHCGEAIKVQAEVCPQCGVRNEQYNRQIGQTDQQTGGFGRSTDTATGGTGLDANVTAALSYVLWFITGIAVYLFEDDEFAQFHAVQSIAIFGALVVADLVVSGTFAAIGIGSVAALLSGLISLVGFGLWVFLIVTAYQGKTTRIPVAADIADNLVSGASRVNRTPPDDGADTDALAALRARYARGEIDETEFERRLERLLETENENERRREPTDPERSH